jgi:cysteine protease ATG4
MEHTHNVSSSDSDSESDDCFTTDEVGGAKGSEFRSLLLFIPLRLGQDKFNMEYKEALKACLSLPQSAGVIGGKPRHALYFIGHHGDNLLYLDPHTTQPSMSCSDSTGMVPDQSYHCSQPDRMNIADLDPSVALAFFCKDESDVDDLCHRLKEVGYCVT